MTTIAEPTTLSSAQEATLLVEGMDCASCAGTITAALGHLPGVSDVNVSVTRERLALSLDAAQTPVASIEKAVRSLGFVPTLVDGKSGPLQPAADTRIAPSAHSYSGAAWPGCCSVSCSLPGHRSTIRCRSAGSR